MSRGARPSQEHNPPSGSGGEGHTPSVTDVNGSVARFDMTYSPAAGRRIKFGPPFQSRWPSAGYLAGGLILGGAVLYAYTAAPTRSWLFSWVVEGDRGRPLPAWVLALVVVVSAAGTVLRTHMRGVIVGDDGIEARYLLAFGIPKTRRWAWPQINRIVMDGRRIALELWDGSYEQLPEVGRDRELANTIAQHGLRRKIDVTVLGSTPG